ncbi:MAG: DUF4350 domain-containing protein [Burkholderiales bacterium]|nr:DUF4350 domain-containing protein [Burkholderiales bacterium]
MSREGIWTAALAALVGLGAIWFFMNFERVTVRERVGMSGEARRNPYLALQRLSGRMGQPARELRTLADLGRLPARGVLLLPRPRGDLGRLERDRILGWVAQGGAIVVEAEPARTADPILDALGVRRVRPSEAIASRPRQVTLAGSDDALLVSLPAAQLLESKHAKHSVDAKDGALLVQIPYGRGLATVLVDLAPLRNDAIGRHDHAEFGWRLARAGGAGGWLLVFDNPEKLSLVDWLRAHAAHALAAAAAFIALWLWRTAPRFGPIAPDPERARRSLLDHLRASGRFLWAAGQGALLAEAAREAALRRLQYAHPDFAGLSASEQRARLAATFGFGEEEARQVLAPQTPRTIPDFVRGVRVCQAIHERLARNR